MKLLVHMAFVTISWKVLNEHTTQCSGPVFTLPRHTV